MTDSLAESSGLPASQAPSSSAADAPHRRGPLADHPLLRYTIRRIAIGAVTLLVASILIFGAVQLLPGNVVTVVLGRSGSPAAVAALSRDLHLNDPFIVRYGQWLGGFLSGNLGHSSAAIVAGNPTTSVWGTIKTPLLNSVILAGITFLLLFPLSLFVGVFAAVRAGRPADHAISSAALVLSALPEFLTGTLFIVIFFSTFNLLPPISTLPPGSTPFASPKVLILPVLTLLGVALAAAARMIRAGTVEILRTNYVAMARLHGLPERRVIRRYAVRNALAPSVQVFAQTIQYLLGGIIIVESVFDYPGIGTALVQAINNRDVQTIEDIAMILAIAFISINIIADVLVVLLVPKLRTTQT